MLMPRLMLRVWPPHPDRLRSGTLNLPFNVDLLSKQPGLGGTHESPVWFKGRVSLRWHRFPERGGKICFSIFPGANLHSHLSAAGTPISCRTAENIPAGLSQSSAT